MEPFIGEIRIFAGDYAPYGWMLCNGQLLSIQQNTALFSILGTTYGGDGQTNFALPDLNGRTAIGQGTGPGLTPRYAGDQGGLPVVTLVESEMPAHTHPPKCQSTATASTPEGNIWSNTPSRGGVPVYKNSGNTIMNLQAVVPAGSSMPHNNAQPYLAMTFIIAVQGIYPPHS